MHLTLILNLPVIIGLCLIPGGIILCFLAGWAFQSWEMAAMLPMAISLFGCWIAAAVLIVLGIGMQIH